MVEALADWAYREPALSLPDLRHLKVRDSVPSIQGVYVLVSIDQGFVYPSGSSNVYYIGMSSDLRRRLKEHQKMYKVISNIRQEDRGLHEWYYPKHQYLTAFGGLVFIYTTRGSQTAKSLEVDLLSAFYEVYHAPPVACGALSITKVRAKKER